MVAHRWQQLAAVIFQITTLLVSSQDVPNQKVLER